MRYASIGIGQNWTSSFHKGLEIRVTNYQINVRESDGRGIIFTKNALGQWNSTADNILVLTQDSSGYTLTLSGNATERYDLSGKLRSETDGAGRTITYDYDTSGRLSTVTGPFGHIFTFGYDSSNRVSTLTTPASQAISYIYDTNNNLNRVNYPDGTAKLYHYENPSFPNHLTGISYVDAGGVTTRYSTYAYDTTGKAIRTEHADVGNGGAQERFLLNYNSATQTTVTDPVNMQEVMTFATNLGVKNLTSKVNQSDLKSVQQTFDTNNNLTCRKDEENRVTLYSYNSTNQKLSTTEGLMPPTGGDCNTCLANPANCNVGGVGRVTTYNYLSATLDLPRFIRRPSVATGQTFETEMVYGDAGHPNLPTQITQRGYSPGGTAVSRSVTLGYNASGQVNSLNGPRTDVSDVTTLEYNECTTGGACGQLKKVTNALGQFTTYDLYDANGRLLQMTAPDGLVTSYTYDPRGRVKVITRTGGGITATWQYSYTPWGDVAQVIDPDGVVLNYQYDAAHDLRYIVDAAGNYLHYTYDLKGNRTGENTHDLSGVLTRTVGYAYDLRNRLSQINLAGDITQVVHDAVGNLLSETDPNNHATTHQYDALNRLLKTVNALSKETVYGQDVNDRPTVVTAPNNLSTEYQHDDLGNLLQESSPDRGPTLYTHDGAGNVITVTNALGQVTTYTYDALNRVSVQQSSEASTPRYNYYYDNACGKGRLCAVQQNGQFHLYFGYDGLGRENYRLNATGAAWVYYAAVYSPGGRLASLTYPTGRSVDYQYDALGRISQVSTTASGTTTVLAKYFIHQPFGPVQNFLFGHNRNYWMSFDRAYRPEFQFSGPYYKRADYDPAGNLKSLTDINNTAQTFGYSPLNELTAAGDTQAGSYGNLAYSYLANGNRESETRNGVSTPYYYYDNTNRLYHAGNSDWRLLDQAGNTIWSNDLWGVSYDGYGRLLSSSKAQSSYGYNALHQRTKKTAGGLTTSFAYGPAGELLYETDGINTKAYVYLGDMPLARVDNNASIYYYHTDHLGAPQIMTNSAGATVWKANYEPFGWAVVTNQVIQNNVRLAGQYFDSETGLHYNWHRYYDPKVGRYITSDPIGLRGGLNTYLYAHANPLRFTDPTGLRVMVTGHIAASPLGRVTNPNSFHTSLYLEPDDPCTCKIKPITVGAQSIGGNLVSVYNYPGDALNKAAFTQVIPTPAGMSDCDFIKSILNSSFRYTSNLPYGFPNISLLPREHDGSMPAGTHNSNSFVSGVLSNAGVVPPTLNTGGQFQTPGYENPIPIGGR